MPAWSVRALTENSGELPTMVAREEILTFPTAHGLAEFSIVETYLAPNCDFPVGTDKVNELMPQMFPHEKVAAIAAATSKDAKDKEQAVHARSQRRGGQSGLGKSVFEPTSDPV